VFQDLTQRKETGLRNEHLLSVATNQNKRLLNFAHIVSHNLRSHSANFKMLLDLLDMSTDELNQSQILSHLRHASDALNETVSHLNEVVSMSHEVVENMRPISLKKAIESASNHFLGLLRKAEVNLDVAPDLKVKAVPAYLDSIFTNLFSNSIRYSSPDRLLSINIKAAIVGDKVIVLFTDNGLGIDLAKHGTKIFGMYKTFHKHPDSKGIGLFIVKNQIEAMNGIITVESKVDQYTTFKLTLDAPN
jgi:signal transduction histidine kinase